MFQHRKKSRIPSLLFGILLFSFPVLAIPPADSVLPELHYSVSGESQVTRSTGTIRILALMVAFEEEENRLTTGNGTFDLPFLQRDDIIIDPLPHNQNYFHTVSGGQLDIQYEVLPDVVPLSEPMRAYSPTGQTNDQNYKLANLARDAWTKAKDLELPDLSDYDQDRTMFIIRSG